MNIPNTLTLLRIFMIPLLVLAFYIPFQHHYIYATGIFLLASITDWFDGYLARKLNQSTPLGAFLDPVADKLMIAVALVILVEIHASPWFAIPAAIIVGREIVISALREWMAELGKRASVAVSYVGKVKTALQMSAIVVLLAVGDRMASDFRVVGYVLLYFAAALTLWSMVIYLKAAWPDLVGHHDTKK